MKKLIMILLAAAAISCNEGSRSSEANDNADNYDENYDNTEEIEPADTATMESDTTNMGGGDMERDSL